MADTRILVINPNSSKSITDGLESSLRNGQPAGVTLSFLTGSSQCPPSINDAPTSIQSAQAVFTQLCSSSTAPSLQDSTDAILVCCFSDHPLVGMLRHCYPTLPCVHILESAISLALSSSSKPFAILTTGGDMVNDIDRGVLNFVGGMTTRYAGCLATNLGVLELREEASRAKVEAVMREKVNLVGQKGVGAIVLGCAGMAGMESFIRQCLAESIGKEAASKVAIIDGAKAGVHLLASLARCQFSSS